MVTERNSWYEDLASSGSLYIMNLIVNNSYIYASGYLIQPCYTSEFRLREQFCNNILARGSNRVIERAVTRRIVMSTEICKHLILI